MIDRACIVGAGSSGIVAAKVLAERGIAFDCFEKGSGVGGNWRYENDNGMSAAYASLHGAIMPLAERQSEWVAALVRGEARLPSPSAMNAEIDRYQRAVRARYVTSPRHTIQVDFHPYLAELARETRLARRR
jgi:cation diffusion facilitator CzcD-associated flavoprotein CzcO